MSDSLLWQNFKSGDADAFSSIYHTYIQELYHYGSKLTADKSLVEDAIHDLFLELWNKRENLGNTNSIKYYLLKCIRRKIVKVIVLHDKVEIDEDYDFELSPAFEEVLMQQQLEEDKILKLNDALSSLTKRQQEAVYLKFYQALSIEEISAIMSLSLKATYNLLSKAIVSLRQNMSKTDFDNVYKKIAI